MLSNATNQPRSTVELGYMCPWGLYLYPWKRKPEFFGLITNKFQYDFQLYNFLQDES